MIEGPTEGFFAFDLQAPARLLTPAFSPARSAKVTWVTLAEPEPGCMWVRLVDDYYMGMQWHPVDDRRVSEWSARDHRQIPVEQFKAWQAAYDAYEKAQDEAWKLYQQEAA